MWGYGQFIGHLAHGVRVTFKLNLNLGFKKTS